MAIPLFDPVDEQHRALVTLAIRAEQFVRDMDLPTRITFQAVRRRVCDALDASGLASEFDEAVTEVLRQAVE